ncbi:type II CAAX endopeptidase family protein [Amycolatopsis keratiniphila]|uniref:type II CAAX endopeptidase family protein n=1 Tax=Amycolatopsis keratiniphila TaxID=129921 RepID=UPI0009F93446|nr:type II CAAX endopeptidase family protein [Amycolatopsis keratiniphila]
MTAHPRPAPGPKRLGSGLRLLGVFLAAELSLPATSVLLLVLLAGTNPTLLESPRLPPWPLVAVLAVPPLVAALVAAMGIASLSGGPRRARIRRELAIRWNRRDLGIGLAFGTGGLLLTIPAAALWSAWVGRDQAHSAIGEVFADRRLSLVVALIAFLTIWLVAPFCEEVLFRGVLWKALEHWHWNRWAIFAVTSALFSIAHLELTRTPLLLVISIPLGLARMYTGNLLASVIAHQMNNLFPAVGLLLATSGWLAA